VVGADRSFGFATTDSLADSQIPPEFGRGVRAIYADIIDERVPDHLGELVAQLENRDGGAYEKSPRQEFREPRPRNQPSENSPDEIGTLS
jgi:hypothetical protein